MFYSIPLYLGYGIVCIVYHIEIIVCCFIECLPCTRVLSEFIQAIMCVSMVGLHMYVVGLVMCSGLHLTILSVLGFSVPYPVLTDVYLQCLKIYAF